MGDKRATSEMTVGQKRECLRLAEQMKLVHGFPGGTAFVVDLFLASLNKTSLVVVDRAEFERLKGNQVVDHEPKRRERPCGDCVDGICTMNCGPMVKT